MKLSLLKICSACEQSKPLVAYHLISDDGKVHPQCKDCLTLCLLRKERSRRQAGQSRERTCSQCEQSFPESYFHWIKASRSYHSYCRACHSAYMAIRYLRKKVSGRRKEKTAGGRTGT